jgi:non-haem dioxygenase in morphine synthesis N-terminal
MDHTAPKTTTKSNTLPVIDISPYLDGHDSHGRISTSAALHTACLDYGFFYLDISKYVDLSEPEELIKLAQEFFDLSQDEKDKLALKNQDHARGMSVLSLRLALHETSCDRQDTQGSKKMLQTARLIIMKALIFTVQLRIPTRLNHSGVKTSGRACQGLETNTKSGWIR